MKINPSGIKVLTTYKNQVNNKKDNPGAYKTNDIPKNDRLEISREARELAKYRQELNKLPDVRHELVDQLKSQIQKGSYRPNPVKIAEGIIQEKLLDEKV